MRISRKILEHLFAVFVSRPSVACSRLSVNGAYRMRPGDVRRAGSGRERGKVVPRPLFQSTPLTESLEQASGGGVCERNEQEEVFFSILTPTQSSLLFTLASSSLAILSARLTIERKDEKTEGCGQSNLAFRCSM